jgi:dimethylaniline monooxygenase (N-oxide forming)
VDPAVVEVAGDTMWLYRHVFPPRWPSLAFIGFCTVGAPVPPAVELQCRWVTAIFAGRLRLPPAEVMQAAVDRHRADCTAAQTHPMKLKMPAYADELAAEIGAQPRWWRHLDLLPQLLLGPMVAAQYRLDGPGKSEAAEATIRRERLYRSH